MGFRGRREPHHATVGPNESAVTPEELNSELRDEVPIAQIFDPTIDRRISPWLWNALESVFCIVKGRIIVPQGGVRWGSNLWWGTSRCWKGGHCCPGWRGDQSSGPKNRQCGYGRDSQGVNDASTPSKAPPRTLVSLCQHAIHFRSPLSARTTTDWTYPSSAGLKLSAEQARASFAVISSPARKQAPNLAARTPATCRQLVFPRAERQAVGLSPGCALRR